MIISVPSNNQAYLTTQNTVTADMNKPSTAVNNIDEHVNAVVEDSDETSIKIADRLAERSNLPAYQQKEAQNTLAHMQNTKSVLSEMESVASQLNQVIDQDEAVDGEKVAQLRTQLKDLTKQLNDVQSSEQKSIRADDREVTVKFNASEISSIAETLSKIEITDDSKLIAKQHLSGEAGLMDQLAKTRSKLDAQLQQAFGTHSVTNSVDAEQSSVASKNSMLDPTGAKQLAGTETTANIAVSILS
ncbi:MULTISPECIES: hypothetical protein [Vibrio]|uniref:Uncharacterized protein n=1 Tax=Vibrio diazotrophicus TaxID=685 RepID=A0A329DS01_VIBDI|nr:hypothetical protein [Vibrio diazotrophicus]PNI00122.1 hypothetical protein C1O25_13085 [Vibrio diazotrophicus]RAS52362.1 hypothetical protein DET48_1698 [Vibrio diazotrophicus]